MLRQYRIKIKGLSPILHHNGAAGLDAGSPANIEKAALTKKKGANRTNVEVARIQQLECEIALYVTADGKPTVPAAALRSCIETGARKLKQGPQVREGLLVHQVEEFIYDHAKLGSTVAELSKSTQFVVPVVVARARVLRTRPKFDDWAVVFTIEVDDELIDKKQLEMWLDISGRRIGLCDWRPEKSGSFGRFTTESITEF